MRWFCVHATATTEIHAYLPTPSLRGALPIRVPWGLFGNMDSQPSFERNDRLCGRLCTTLYLTPLAASKQSDAIHFKAFCTRYADKLVESGAVRKSPGLRGSAMLEGLFIASGGHVGRVSRILDPAVGHAAARKSVV